MQPQTIIARQGWAKAQDLERDNRLVAERAQHDPMNLQFRHVQSPRSSVMHMAPSPPPPYVAAFFPFYRRHSHHILTIISFREPTRRRQTVKAFGEAFQTHRKGRSMTMGPDTIPEGRSSLDTHRLPRPTPRAQNTSPVTSADSHGSFSSSNLRRSPPSAVPVLEQPGSAPSSS